MCINIYTYTVYTLYISLVQFLVPFPFCQSKNAINHSSAACILKFKSKRTNDTSQMHFFIHGSMHGPKKGIFKDPCPSLDCCITALEIQSGKSARVH